MSWIRRLALLGIALLYLLAVPWFREAGAEPEIVFGLPDWTAWTLLCFCGVAVLNALASWWLSRRVYPELRVRVLGFRRGPVG